MATTKKEFQAMCRGLTQPRNELERERLRKYWEQNMHRRKYRKSMRKFLQEMRLQKLAIWSLPGDIVHG